MYCLFCTSHTFHCHLNTWLAPAANNIVNLPCNLVLIPVCQGADLGQVRHTLTLHDVSNGRLIKLQYTIYFASKRRNPACPVFSQTSREEQSHWAKIVCGSRVNRAALAQLSSEGRASGLSFSEIHHSFQYYIPLEFWSGPGWVFQTVRNCAETPTYRHIQPGRQQVGRDVPASPMVPRWLDLLTTASRIKT